MKKKTMLLISSILMVTIAGACFASTLSNKNYPFARATNSEVPHQIIFGANEANLLINENNRKGVYFVKNNATRSGNYFEFWAYCSGDSYNVNTTGNLLYCETEGEQLSPNSKFTVEFYLKNVASFTSVILHGEFYNNGAKTEITDEMAVDATYNESNKLVTGQAQVFKGNVTSIELNYTCAA